MVMKLIYADWGRTIPRLHFNTYPLIFLLFVFFLGGAGLPAYSTTYRTIAPGHWKHSGNWLNGMIPPATIVYGDTVIVEHDMFWNHGGDLEVYGNLEVYGTLDQRTGLMLPSGKDVRIYGSNANVILINAILNNTGAPPSGNASLYNYGGNFYAFNSIVEMARYIVNDNASSTYINTCVSVGRDFTSTNSEETVEGSTITVGLNTKGGFQFSGGIMECQDARFEVLSKKNGSFSLNSGMVAGIISAIKVTSKGGDIYASSNVTGNLELDYYCVTNGSFINGGAFITSPVSNDCGQTDSYFPCDAFAAEFSFDDANVVLQQDDTARIRILNYLYDIGSILNAGEFDTSMVTHPSHGSLQWDILNSEFTYIPNSGFSGEDTFAYVVCDNIPYLSICDTAMVFLVVSPDMDSISPVVNDTVVSDFLFDGTQGQNWPDALAEGWSGFQVEQVHDPNPMLAPDHDFLGLKYNDYNRLGSSIETPPIDFGNLKSFTLSFRADGYGAVSIYIADSTDIYQIGHEVLPGGYGSGNAKNVEITINDAWLFDEAVNPGIKGTPTILIEYENPDKSTYGRMMDLKMEGDMGTVWLGDNTDLWFENDDWTNGHPTRDKEGLIPNERPRYPSIYGRAESSYLKVEDQAYFVIKPNSSLTSYGALVMDGEYSMCIHSDASGTGSYIDKAGLKGEGGAYIEQYVTEEKWHYTSSPISNGLSKTYLSLYLIPYLESQNDWGDYIVPLDIPLNVMQGYGVWSSATWPPMGDTTVWFGGGPNTGEQSIMVTNSGYSGDPQYDGWNLVGNPYPSAVHWDSLGWDKSNITGSVYLWDPVAMSYRVYMGEGMGIPYGVTGEIQQGQGFFVKAVSNGQFSVENSARMHSGTDWLKSGNQPKASDDCVLFLALDGNGYHDETAVRFKDGASSSYENNMDAYKLLSTEDYVPQLFSYTIGSNPVRLAINTYPMLSAPVSIPIGFHYGTPGTYTIGPNAMESLPQNLGLVLEDLKADSMISLDMQSHYTFVSDSGDVEERFILHFNPAVLKGSLAYNGDTARPLSGVDISISDLSSSVIYQTQSAANGGFSIGNIPDGSYEVDPDLSNAPWKGINATDALMASRHFVGLANLSSLEQLAGDVDGSGYTNAADALAIQQRFVGYTTAFNSGDWVVGDKHVTILGNGEFSPVISAICMGDVNASWNNSKRQGDIRVAEYGSFPLEPNQAFNLQLFAGTACQLGALTLVLELPEGIEISEVDIANSEINAVYRQNGNQLFITWFSLDALNLEVNDLLLTLRGETASVPETEIRVNALSEAANAVGDVIPDFKVLLPGISEDEQSNRISIYPNPASGAAQLVLSSEKEGTMVCELLDASGRLVRTWQEYKTKGETQHPVNLEGLDEGHYILKVSMTTGAMEPLSIPVILMK